MSDLRFGCMILPRSLTGTVEAAREAERWGFHWLGVADTPTVYQESYLHQLEAARATREILVGPLTGHVTVRHPVIVGNLLATMQEFTGGRTLPVLATGNSAARGLGMAPAHVEQLAEAVGAIRSYWRGEGGRYGSSFIPATGIAREECPIYLAADGPRTMEMAGQVGDGVLYGGTLEPAVLARRIAAARRRSHLSFWAGPAASLAETPAEAGAELGALLVAMANRALRGDLEERGIPAALQDGIREMWRRYDYGFHADTTRPRNESAVDAEVADYLVEHLCVWGSEARWRATLDRLADAGVDGVMFILSRSDGAGVRAIGERLAALGLLTPQRTEV